MTPERWAQVKRLLAAAMDLPAADRPQFLAREAGADSGLIGEVQSLLDAHEQPGAFLDTVTHEFRAQAFAASSAARSRLGERIGAYRIVGVLGTGGMGDVFEAVRDDDQYQAKVAIKLMRADMRSAHTEQRFKTERQILAGLDHRNIARLLDGGTTDGGMPYVVMELVSGDPVDAWCEARKLGVRERVQLFLQVCAAVSYAHQHLIVHRDLKPNNILVTADGSVKLLDFGIAKLLEANADTAVAEADATVTTLRAMTLEYASPEQVSGGKVTTVSDVYSLGVVFYRLLTGKSPYRERTDDVRRMAEILSDTSPTRPSLVDRKLDGDLDNILLMALRKEPERRYGSVEQLANDLRNYLSGLPVRARGNSLRYRAGKFIRRRKVEIAAAVLVGCALLGALAISWRETRIAEQQRQVAQQHFNSVRKLANTLLFELHDEIAKVPESTKTREMLVKTSLEYLDSLYQQAGNDRSLQQELGVAYKKVGDIQGNQVNANLGDHEAALRNYTRAIHLLEPLMAAEPADLVVALNLSSAYIRRADLLLVAGKTDDALASATQGVTLMEGLRPHFASNTATYTWLGAAYWSQAEVLAALGRSSEKLATLDKLMALADEFASLHPNDVSAIKLVSDAYNNASLHVDAGQSLAQQLARSLALQQRSLVAAQRLVELEPDNAEHRANLAVNQSNLGRDLYVQGDFAGALKYYELASEAFRIRARDSHDAHAQYLSGLVDSAHGATLLKLGRVEEARAMLVRCHAALDRLQKQAGSLRIEYALGHTGVRLGELYATLASDPRTDGSTRADYWRQAKTALQRGLAELQHVAAAVTLEPRDRAAIDEGVALLARVEAAQ